MKNIILSVIVVGLVVGGGYYFFSDRQSSVADEMIKVSLDNFNDSENRASETETTTAPTNESGQNIINLNQAPKLAVGQEPKPAVGQAKKTYMITIETNFGKIVIETYNTDAPKTVENFVTLAQKGFYNGLIFHRIIKGFMIQGGDPNGNGTGGPGYKFEDELNPNTDSYKAGYKKGVVAMANSGPNTNGSQFFIMHEDNPLPNAYTIFGKVVSGQDVVDKMANVSTGANDRPISPVVMSRVIVE